MDGPAWRLTRSWSPSLSLSSPSSACGLGLEGANFFTGESSRFWRAISVASSEGPTSSGRLSRTHQSVPGSRLMDLRGNSTSEKHWFF